MGDSKPFDPFYNPFAIGCRDRPGAEADRQKWLDTYSDVFSKPRIAKKRTTHKSKVTRVVESMIKGLAPPGKTLNDEDKLICEDLAAVLKLSKKKK